MPELPEVETVRRGLEPAMVGRRIVAATARRPDLRWPLPECFAERLTGRTVTALGRRAKYLVGDLDDGQVWLAHLGMSGSFRIEREGAATPGGFHHPRPKAAAHDHVELLLDDGTRIVYNDPRRFGAMDLAARDGLEGHPWLARLGLEPLGNALSGKVLMELFDGRTTPLKAMLLDQTRIAGLGNIYVCEALHRAGLSPTRAAGTVKPAAAAKLAEAIRATLEEAIVAGGSTLRDHRSAEGELGYFQHSFRVYDREDAPCPTPRCRGVVRRTVQAGRSTFHCTLCQR